MRKIKFKIKKIFLFVITSLFSLILSAQNQDTIRIREVVVRGSTINNYKVFNLEKKNDAIKSTGELMKEIPGVTIVICSLSIMNLIK